MTTGHLLEEWNRTYWFPTDAGRRVAQALAFGATLTDDEVISEARKHTSCASIDWDDVRVREWTLRAFHDAQARKRPPSMGLRAYARDAAVLIGSLLVHVRRAWSPRPSGRAGSSRRPPAADDRR
jgi:hypothetical protein